MSRLRGSVGDLVGYTLLEEWGGPGSAAQLAHSPGGAAQPAGAKESSASTEAATKVGAGLSAKDRRTYWQASAEGSEARQQ